MSDDFVPLTGDPTATLKPASTKGAAAANDFVPLGDKPMGGVEESVMDPRPFGVKALEFGVTGAGATIGGGLGGAVGSAAGPIGTIAGSALGATAGMTYADYINKKIDENLGYAKKTPVTGEGLKQDVTQNAIGAAVGEVASPLIGKAAGAAGRAIAGPLFKQAEGEAGKIVGAEGVDEGVAAFNHMHSQAAEDAYKAVSDAREAELRMGGSSSLRNQARQEAIGNELGKTPERSLAARTQPPTQGVDANGQPVTEPSPQFTARQTGFWNSVYGPVNRSAKNLGAQFESLFKPHLTKVVDSTPLIATLADEEAYAREKVAGGFSRGVQKVFNEIDPDNYRLNPNAGQLMSVPSGQEPIPRLQRPAQISKLLAVRSQIGAMMPSATGPDKAALTAVREKLDDVLADSGVPGAQELRAKYRVFKGAFDKTFYRGVSGVADPAEAIPTLLESPQRAQMLFGAMTPPEKAVTKNAFADYMNEMGPDGKLVNMSKVRPDWAPALKELGYTGLLADPKSWAHMAAAVPADIEWLNGSPQAYKQLEANTWKVFNSQKNDVAEKAAKEGLAEAKRMGGVTGQRITEAINAGRTPEEKMNAALKAFEGLSQEGANAETAGAQQTARMNVLSGKTPAAAPTGIVNRLRNYAERYGIFALAFAGAGSSMAGGMEARAATMAAAFGVLGLMSKAVNYGINKNPETAQALYNALLKPGTDSFYKTVASMAVKGAVSAATAKAGKDYTGADLSKGAKPERPPFPKVTFPPREAPDTAFRKALFSDRLKTDSIKSSSGDLAGFKSSSYKNALIQGIKAAKTPEAAQQLAEQMYNRGLISAEDVKSAVSAAKDLPIADELKRSSLPSLLKNYKAANEGERDALDAEIEHRFEDNPKAFQKKELAPYKHLVLKVLSERDKHASSASEIP